MTMHPPYVVENQPVAAPVGPVVALPLVERIAVPLWV